MPSTPSPPRRRLPAGIWLLGFVSLFMDVSSEMIHALLPVYLVGVLGASMLTVGALEGFAEATALVVRVFSGALSDRLGQRKLLAAAGYGLAAFTKPVFPLAGSIGWLVAARLVDRIGKGIRGAPRDALVADLSPPELRGASFGLRQSLDTVGAFLGPLLAIVLMAASGDDYTLVFWVAVLPAFLSFGLITVAVREPPRSARPVPAAQDIRRWRAGRLPRAFWLVAAVGAVLALARFSEAFLVLRAGDAGLKPTFAPLVLVAMNVAYALSAYPIGALSDRLGRGGIVALGVLLLVAADLILAFAASVPLVFAGIAVWGLHMGFTQGLLAAMVADTAPADLRGTAFGVFNLVSGAAMLAASLAAGLLWDRFGAGAAFLAGAALAATALAGLVLTRRRLAPIAH